MSNVERHATSPASLEDLAYHYPPDLVNLLVETIPRLCRSKNDVLVFFLGAGVHSSLMTDLDRKLREDRASITKFDIVRTVVMRLNEKRDVTLRERREILRRITQWEDFSTCWESDRLQAVGLVSRVRDVVNVRDAFTRMNLEREAERQQQLAELRAQEAASAARRARLQEVKRGLFSLFSEQDPQRRGKALEGVLNRLFKESGVLVRETFSLQGSAGEGITEQIDGVIEIDGEIYLVEMKWLNEPAGKGDVSQLLVGIFNRSDAARGIIISASGFTEPAISTCRDALHNRVVVLMELRELVLMLEQERDLRELLKVKVNAAIIDKSPLYRPLD